MPEPKTLIEAVRHFTDLDVCHADERWAVVVGNPKYEVSTCGRLRSVPRRVVAGHGWRDIAAAILSPRADDAGYIVYVLVDADGKPVRVYLHRLVLEAFVGPCPDDMEARHFPDGDPANNHLDNLSWATHAENIADRKTHGTSPDGERSWTAKLTDDDVRRIKRRLAAGEGQRSIARDFPVGRSLVQAIKSGKVWSHVTI